MIFFKLSLLILLEDPTLITDFKINLPATVFRYMRYSKFEISLLCHACVMLDALNSCFALANDTRLQEIERKQ